MPSTFDTRSKNLRYSNRLEAKDVFPQRCQSNIMQASQLYVRQMHEAALTTVSPTQSTGKVAVSDIGICTTISVSNEDRLPFVQDALPLPDSAKSNRTFECRNCGTNAFAECVTPVRSSSRSTTDLSLGFFRSAYDPTWSSQATTPASHQLARQAKLASTGHPHVERSFSRAEVPGVFAIQFPLHAQQQNATYRWWQAGDGSTTATTAAGRIKCPQDNRKE